MKVYIYGKSFKRRKREKVEVIENVVSVNEFFNCYFIHHDDKVTHVDKDKYMITIYGY